MNKNYNIFDNILSYLNNECDYRFRCLFYNHLYIDGKNTKKT